MDVIKKVCKAVGVACLAATIVTENIAFAMVTVVFTAVAIGIDIKD